MKRIFIVALFFVGISALAWGQTLQKTFEQDGTLSKVSRNSTFVTKPSMQKDLACSDTLYYPYFKETELGTSTFYFIEFVSGEKVSQTYLNSSSTSVSGARFDCAIGGTNAAATVNIQVDLYNVDAAFQPTTAIAGATGTVAVTGTTYTEYGVIFSSPVSVTGNYAVVLTHVSTSDTVKFYANNAGTNTYGEGLGYLYFSGAWYDNNTAFGGTYDFDFMAYPIVSYPITTDYTSSDADYNICPGTAVTFTTNITPTAVLSNRMYNWDSFLVYWGISTDDSLTTWDMGDGSPLLWTGNHTYTFNTSGLDTVYLFTLGGFYNRYGCFDGVGYIFNVYNNPTVTATALPTAVCTGSQSTLTAYGANTYNWSTGATLNEITVTPSETTTYTVTGTDANLCTNSTTVTVTQYLPPTIGINASATTICEGNSVTLTGTGGVSYDWGPFGTSNSIEVYPTTTTTYNVVGQDGNGCTGLASIQIIVNTKPTINPSANPASVCPGIGSSLSATGGVSYAWNPGNLSGTPVNVTPTTTTVYTVTGTDANTCTNTATVTVNVFTAPTVGLVATISPICNGQNTTLNASGASTYLWSHSLPAGGSNNVSPTSTTTYFVTGTDANNCTAVASATVTVNQKPTITASATPSTLCTGQSTTLSASNGVSYNWDNGIGAGNNIIQTPLTNTTYSVTGTDANNCTNSASVLVTVAPCTQPTASISVSDNEICVGDSITYTDNSSGVNVNTWMWTFTGGNISTAGTQGPHTVKYNSAGNHTVNLQVTDDNGTDDTTITIIVHALPTVTADVSVSPICSGSQTNLNAYGATTYLWNGGSTDNPYSVSPTSTTTYTVTGTDANGCKNVATVVVNVNTLPTITLTSSANNFCAGNPTTLTAGGGTSYTWNQGLSGTQNVVNPTTNTTYSITGTDANNCQNTASVSVNVIALPTVMASANPTNICPGGESVLTATGNATGYSWDGSTLNNPITVNPTTTTTYTVYGANTSACTASASVTVTVLVAPTITASANPDAVCEGSTSVLTAGGGDSYVWTGSITTNPQIVTPTSTTTYSVTGTDAAGCTGEASVTVTVNALPTVTVNFPPEVEVVCKDSLVALSGGSPAGGVWSGIGVTGSNFTANTTGTFNITYTYTDANNCSNSATGTITVENCTSISEYSSNEMIVYPNPASDVITISFGKVDASKVEITMFDIFGCFVSNDVLNLNGSSVEVSLNQLTPGVYTLKVKVGSDVFFTKITRL